MPEDPEEIAFQNTLNEWEAKSKKDQRMLSPQRFFFHSGYDAARLTISAGEAEIPDRKSAKALRSE